MMTSLRFVFSEAATALKKATKRLRPSLASIATTLAAIGGRKESVAMDRADLPFRILTGLVDADRLK
jgi:hypothetical protein